METRVMLEDGTTIGGRPLWDHFEAINHALAHRPPGSLVKEGFPLVERILKDLYQLVFWGLDSEVGRCRAGFNRSFSLSSFLNARRKIE